MKTLLALALILAPAAASADTAKVVVADGDWSYLPSLERAGQADLSPTAMAALYELTSERKCKLPGQSYRQLNLRLSFAAHFTPSGQLAQLVLPKLDCPQAEGIIAGALLDLIRAGGYRPDGSNPDGWYRGDLAFGMRG